MHCYIRVLHTDVKASVAIYIREIVQRQLYSRDIPQREQRSSCLLHLFKTHCTSNAFTNICIIFFLVLMTERVVRFRRVVKLVLTDG
jgi:hypothetical protein